MEDPASKGEESPKKLPPTPRIHLNIGLNPYPTDLLLRTTASTPIYGAVTRHSPLYPYSIPSTPIPTPGPEDFSANTTSPTPTRSIGRCDTFAAPQAIPESVAPGPSFDPTIQDQSKQCEYHRGASGHTLDACWRLRERIQEMIDAKELVFNAVRPPNVQANPLPDHGPARGPSINMITVCTSREGKSEQ
ncbi:hypothetical protein CRG98_002225, partial [Punica granatum]